METKKNIDEQYLSLDPEGWEYVRTDKRITQMHICEACHNKNVKIVIKLYHCDLPTKNLYVGENCAAYLCGYGDDVTTFRQDLRSLEQRLRDQIAWAEGEIVKLENRSATIGDSIDGAKRDCEIARSRVEESRSRVEQARRRYDTALAQAVPVLERDFEIVRQKWFQSFEPCKNTDSKKLRIKTTFFQVDCVIYERDGFFRYVVDVPNSHNFSPKWKYKSLEEAAVGAYHEYNKQITQVFSKPNLEAALTR